MAVYLAVAAAMIVVAAPIAWRALARRRATRGAASDLELAMSVWAPLGPFASGTESAWAMDRGLLALFAANADREQFSRLSERLKEHARAFDADPAEWERTRDATLARINPEAAKLAEVIPIWAWSPERFDRMGTSEPGRISRLSFAGALIASGLDWPRIAALLEKWKRHPAEYEADPDWWEGLRDAARSVYPLTEEQEQRRKKGLAAAADLLEKAPT